jgi:hypothetical protein
MELTKVLVENKNGKGYKIVTTTKENRNDVHGMKMWKEKVGFRGS